MRDLLTHSSYYTDLVGPMLTVAAGKWWPVSDGQPMEENGVERLSP